MSVKRKHKLSKHKGAALNAANAAARQRFDSHFEKIKRANLKERIEAEQFTEQREQQQPPRIRLISKRDVLARTHLTYPTIWKLMREGKFPRSRALLNKAVWVEDEVEAWIAAMPMRELKGDAAQVETKIPGT
jgi:predicted DNA-binding transcriptional regulator AlpA